MARVVDKNKAITLRKQGWSYSQIKAELNVGKGTLNAWLKDYPLAPERLKELLDVRALKIERYLETRRQYRKESLEIIKKEQSEKIFPLSNRDLFIAGLFLYWGEGGKTKLGNVSLSNTDPSVLRFFINWAINYAGHPKEKIKATLHLYNDMNIQESIKFWANALDLPVAQFHKPYIKKTLFKNLTYKNGFGHGTCNIGIFSAKIAQQVLMGIKALQEYFK